jgi:hypothetical protein
MGFAGALSVLPLAWLAERVIEKVARLRGTPHAALKQAAVGLGGMLLIMPFMAINLFAKPTAAHAETSASGPIGCDIDRSARLLASLPPTTVFAPLDIGPDILADTRHSVVATGHHRAGSAMRDVIQAYMAPEGAAHAIVAAHRAGLLAICTDLGETERYVAQAPHGLMAQLVRGKVPAWLQPVNVGGPATFRVWRVVG